MLREAGVTLFERHRLKEKNGVEKAGNRVTAILTENGGGFAPNILPIRAMRGT